jgi:hypothetical protein
MNMKILKNLLIYAGSPRPPAGGSLDDGILGAIKNLSGSMVVFLLSLSLPARTQAVVESSTIQQATQYPGCQTEKLLNDLLRADYHAALSKYYQHREKAGFMALERFELALTRAIGDIRTIAYIKDLKERQSEALKVSKNWQQAFERAMVKNTLDKK